MQELPKNILKQYWGFTAFRGSQEPCINALLNQKDVFALMPTGGGKSLCYQIPALALEGICIVVSPLIALIQNQVDNLKSKNIKAIALTGGISFEELNNLLDNCLYGNYKFLYLSPERLQQSLVQDRIRQMNVSLLAIDEAHCISQWGNDFRPSYLECAVLREMAPKAPMIALTATATKKVQIDILENLKLRSPLIVKDSFERKNIGFQVILCEDKRYPLEKLFKKYKGCAIVYVRTRRKTFELSNHLNKLGISATFYHGGLSKEQKKDRLNVWLKDDVRAMVATNAFGMGVDKADVRMVLHYQIPDSIENYFQEAGRCGRDGKAAKAILLYKTEDIVIAEKQFIHSLPDAQYVKQVYGKLNTYFQIAYGEGSGESFDLNFNDFCGRYELNPFLAHNALRILDQHAVISLTEAFNQKSTLLFTVTKATLFDYLDANPTLAHILVTTLRTYGGLFDYETPVNLNLLSKKLNLSEQQIKKVFEKLQDDDIAICNLASTDLKVTFLVSREDDRTINPFAPKIRALNQNKLAQFDAIMAYIKNEKLCRSQFLLAYFGEKDSQKCGQCDICKSYNATKDEVENLKLKIVGILAKKSLSSRNLSNMIEEDESMVIDALRELLENETISLNQKNEYGLS
ncbi:MAG: RecQ family ATP-dependent DNA helicase [Croceitalea sp.]|nr:RecQ family ATP-dependent DNA helicase [Croceitalea sp.]